MLIQSLEQKTRLALTTVILAVAGATVTCIGIGWKALEMVQTERNQIYVLDGDIPFLAERAQLEANFVMEAKAHVQLFHQTVYIIYIV